MSGPLPLAFIGAHSGGLASLPREWRELFTAVAAFTARQGLPLHTGATPGCEQWAAEAALGAGGTVHLFQPWRRFEAAWIDALKARYGERVAVTVSDANEDVPWRTGTGSYPSHSASLGPKARKRIGCVCAAIRGCRGVVALPPCEEDRTDGTTDGIGLARALGIEVWDLRHAPTRGWWKWRLERRAMTREEFKTYLTHLAPARFKPGVLDRALLLVETAPPELGPWAVTPYDTGAGCLLEITWRGHNCRLRVMVHPDGWETRPDFLEPGASDLETSWRFVGVAPQLEYVRDSIPAGSLGLTVAEWRALTQPTLP